MQKQKTNATSYLNPVKKSVSGNASIKSALISAPWIVTGLSVRKNAEKKWNASTYVQGTVENCVYVQVGKQIEYLNKKLLAFFLPFLTYFLPPTLYLNLTSDVKSK